MIKRKDVKELTWRQLVDGEAKSLEKYFPETMWYYVEGGDEDWSSYFFKREREALLKQLVF